jgi:hypothetical protein
MSDTHDYLEDQLRDVEADVKRAARRADAIHRAINPVSDFGHDLRLEVFSVHQALEAAMQRIEEARQKIRTDRKARRR